MQTNKTTQRSPWLWIPTLYFAEGIPYFLVNNISVMMFTRMGVPNGQMAFFTSLLYLPWMIKPFWSPFVDILKTKRWWVITMQILMTAAFVALTLTVPHPSAETIASGSTSMWLFWPMLILFVITAFASATHDIAADGFYMLALTQHDQAAFIGARSVFYRLSSIFGQGVLFYVAGVLENRTGNIPMAWQLTLLLTSVIFAGISLWHVFFIPKPANDVSSMAKNEAAQTGQEDSDVLCKDATATQDATPSVGDVAREFGRTFADYFRKPGIVLAVVFMLLYRLPEAFISKMMSPFLVASKEMGGLALTTDTVGVAYGTIGVVALMLGGILGGIYASRVGLKKALWWMALAVALPCFAYVYMSVFQPDSIVAISAAIAVDQFGYGFGFTAYMLYMMYFSEGEFKTAHYAICTAFMAASMILPGAVAGFLQEALGYVGFFWMVMVCCIATLVVAVFAARKVDPNYGKK